MSPLRPRRLHLLPSLAILLLSSAAGAETAIYDVDSSHSGVNFGIRHFLTTVPGQFERFSGVVEHDPERPEATRISFTVDATSIDTRSEQRDAHLRGEDFFDTAAHPTLTFESVAARRLDADTLEVTGDLTMRGETRRITVPVDFLGVMDTPMGTRASFATEFTVDRNDYGISWNRALEGGGAVLGDEVEIAISVQGVRREPPAAE